MKEAWPKHSERVNEVCCGEMYRGNGSERGLRREVCRVLMRCRSVGEERGSRDSSVV